MYVPPPTRLQDQRDLPEGQLLDTIQAARLLNLSRHTLIRWRTAGGGPVYLKLGRRVLYDPVSIDQWLTDRTRKNTAEYLSRHGPDK
jgi:predicted DNA-binding transcriptional regulator AlpA